MHNDSFPTTIDDHEKARVISVTDWGSDRPYTALVYGYKNRLEQIHKFIAALPDRIGDRDYRIYLHDHAQGEECNDDCDLIEKVKDAT